MIHNRDQNEFAGENCVNVQVWKYSDLVSDDHFVNEFEIAEYVNISM